MEYTVPAPGIILFTNVFDDYKQLISDIEKSASDPSQVVFWKRATVSGSGNVSRAKSEQRTNSNLVLDSNWIYAKNEIMQFAGNVCLSIMKKAQEGIDEYYKNFYPSINPMPAEMIVLKYQTGQEYKQHVDAGTKNNRIVSMVMYLNDDYEGGNIEFPYLNFNLKPPANSMIFFPSNYIYAHIAHPVTEGTKYAVVQWITENHGD
jgi:hypothetical protein